MCRWRRKKITAYIFIPLYKIGHFDNGVNAIFFIFRNVQLNVYISDGPRARVMCKFVQYPQIIQKSHEMILFKMQINLCLRTSRRRSMAVRPAVAMLHDLFNTSWMRRKTLAQTHKFS